jgi:hypothetical protein
MPLAPTSYDASVSAAAVTMLSVCASFQAWTGTANPTDAVGWIIEDDGGLGSLNYSANNTPLTPADGNWAAVRLGESKRVQRAFNTWGHAGDFDITLMEHITAGDKPAEVVRRARNNAGQIASDLQALFGSNAGYIVYGEVDCGKEVIQDPTGSLKDYVVTRLSITWRDIP